jgi:hypothetical protein
MSKGLLGRLRVRMRLNIERRIYGGRNSRI